MLLRLYYDSTTEPLSTPVNEGYAIALALLKQIEAKGIESEWVDTSKLTDKEKYDAYLDAIAPSVFKKYRIRQVFGSRRRSGWLFGNSVPALIVMGPRSRYAEDVYPRDEHGRIVTIKEYLQQLLDRINTSE